MKNPVFVMVCCLIAVAPLFRGSVHAWAQTLIQAMVGLGGILLVLEAMRSKGLRKERSRSPDRRNSSSGRAVGRSGAAGNGLTCGKLFWYVALPCAAVGVWSTVMSPHPALAVQGLLMLLTYLGFFFLVVLSVRTRQEQRTLVWVIAGTAGVLCVAGLLELYDVMVFPWWDYTAETRNAYMDSLTGAYVNHNHMAGFLEMAIPVLLVMFLTRFRPMEGRIALICLAVFLVVCQALTLSRGGWAGTAGALAFMAAALLFKKDFAHKRVVGTLAAGIVVTAAIVTVSTPVVERILTLTRSEMRNNIAHRLNLWEGTGHMIKDNLAAGTGPGTFRTAYPPYQQPGYPVLSAYAHNDYLQITAETGILAIPLMLWLLFLFFRSGFKKFNSRSRQTSGIALGCMAAVTAILIHGYSDGNLQIPANALLFTSLTAITLK